MASLYAKVLLGFLFSTEDIEVVWRSARDLDQLAFPIHVPGAKHIWQSHAKETGRVNREAQLPLPASFGSCVSMLERLLVALESTAGLTLDAAPLNGDQLRGWAAALVALEGEIAWFDDVRNRLQWIELQRESRLLMCKLKDGGPAAKKEVARGGFRKRWLCCGP